LGYCERTWGLFLSLFSRYHFESFREVRIFEILRGSRPSQLLFPVSLTTKHKLKAA